MHSESLLCAQYFAGPLLAFGYVFSFNAHNLVKIDIICLLLLTNQKIKTPKLSLNNLLKNTM